MASPVSAGEERPPAGVGGRGGSHSLRAVTMHLLCAQPHVTPVVPALGILPYSGGLTSTDPTGNSMDRLRGFCSWGCQGPGRGSGEASGSQGPRAGHPCPPRGRLLGSDRLQEATVWPFSELLHSPLRPLQLNI